MPPSPQTMNANRRGADAAGTAAPSSPTNLQPRKNSSHFTSPKGSPKTPKASRKACPEEDEQPEADPCEDALQMFAGRYGFTVTTTNTCTTYSNARAPAGTKPAEATQAPVALMPANWSPMQSMGLGFQFVPTPHYQGGQDHQHGQQQQQGPSSPTRTTPTKPGSPGKVRRQGSPSKGKRDGSQSPSRKNNSGNAQQHAASAAYQQILRRRLRRPKSRGPSYDPSIKTAAAAAAHYGTGASLLGKHRLSNCSSMEEAAAGPEGMPHEWAGDATGGLWLYGPDGWDEDDAFASGCLEEAASMMADSLGLGGFEGYVWPLDGAFAEEDGPQLQPPVYACTPAAAAAAAAAGMMPGAGRASSMSSDWFREMSVQDMAVSRRSSLFGDNMSINAPAAAAPAAAGPGMGYWRSSDAEVESALQRGLEYMPVWGVQANVGEVLMQHKVIDGGTTPDKYYDGLCKGPC
ncbi:hypothetical protein OEZ86_000892 [Tetradesmus obliquus]|nr:hypothetical protein OEZ86_000892 [Tetradesmus obliquus]